LSTILAPIDTAVAWIITQLFNLFSPAFGQTSGVTWLLTIVILVVIMRLILVPLFIKQMHTQRAMTALTPKIAELRKKHKGDRETLNAETMKLYQEAGVNPLMGCLPILLQMPIFFGLFSVLRYIAEWSGGKTSWGLTPTLIHSAQQAKIFGATIADKVLFTKGLHVPVEAKVVIVITVAISMATTYLTVRQSMKRGMMPTGTDTPMGQSQKLMAYIMPLFALTGLYWQFGLVLYWVTTNLWTLGQQFVLLRKYPIGAAAMGPGGNLPTGGAAGKPATASGLTSGRSAKPRPGTGSSGSGKNRGGTTSGGSGKSGASGGARKPGSGPQPGSGTGGKPVSTSKPSAQAGGKSAQADGKSAPTDGKSAPTDGKSAPTDGKSAKPADATGSGGSSSEAGTGATGTANGHKAGEGGVLRRFGRGRSEPEPSPPPAPETKIVRQQRTRQSRSKRTGKR
jgi:YidC/Oxa1 family membrane protein insertase